MDKWTPPPVGPPDEEGFRTFSIHSDAGAEIIRVSFNLDRMREWLAETAEDEGEYNQQERDRLKLAARIVAARDAFPGDNEDALAFFRHASPRWIATTLETHFPSLAVLSLQVASAICVKRGLNRTVQSAGAPPMYDSEMIPKIFRYFESIGSVFLEIGPGRPLETERHLSETKQALKLLEGNGKIHRGKKLPTQEVVAAKIGITSRALRDARKACNLKWHEFLRACGWPVHRKEINTE